MKPGLPIPDPAGSAGTTTSTKKFVDVVVSVLQPIAQLLAVMKISWDIKSLSESICCWTRDRGVIAHGHDLSP